VLVLVGINAAFTLSVPNVSWQAHLGGFVGGALVASAIVWAPRAHRTLVQWGGTAAVTGLVVALVVARTLALV
jgi:membrane associated rhomboid family serine protease